LKGKETNFAKEGSATETGGPRRCDFEGGSASAHRSRRLSQGRGRETDLLLSLEERNHDQPKERLLFVKRNEGKKFKSDQSEEERRKKSITLRRRPSCQVSHMGDDFRR